LVSFLDGEIRAEKDQSNVPKSGPGVPGFEVKTVGSRITLVRKQNDETITVKLNVNGSVDTEGPSEEELEAANAQGQAPDASMIGDMKSRPDFTIEIAKPNGRILAFNCRLYTAEELPPDQPEADKFEIEGFTILNAEDIDEDGDWSDNLYVGDAGIVDGQMYDLLMNFLDSRGIGNEFVDHLIDYSTFYEHSKYINLLDDLKSFLSGK
jgi:complement component 1 Q subcomponent-binding protein